MKKIIKMTIELTYDTETMYSGDDKTAKDWFFNYILKKDKLTLLSDEIGDEVGTVKVLTIIKEK